jgi:hypothetical protein
MRFVWVDVLWIGRELGPERPNGIQKCFHFDHPNTLSSDVAPVIRAS